MPDRIYSVNLLDILRISGLTRRFARNKREPLDPLAIKEECRGIRLRFREQDGLNPRIIQRGKKAVPFEYRLTEFKPASTVDLPIKFVTFQQNLHRMREWFRVPGLQYVCYTEHADRQADQSNTWWSSHKEHTYISLAKHIKNR